MVYEETLYTQERTKAEAVAKVPSDAYNVTAPYRVTSAQISYKEAQIEHCYQVRNSENITPLPVPDDLKKRADGGRWGMYEDMWIPSLHNSNAVGNYRKVGGVLCRVDKAGNILKRDVKLGIDFVDVGTCISPYIVEIEYKNGRWTRVAYDERCYK